ncbi:addiction module antidote protein, HigA family [bacterium CPR1]|nr:addiction module antidote protein, HigA family [bacterium CPR1]
MRKTSPRPFRPIRPGEILQEELDARGWSQAELAEIMERPVQAVNEIVVGKKAITAETARQLARVFETTPEYWLNLETSYRLDLASATPAGKEDEVERRARLHDFGPIKEMLNRGWITVRDPKNLDQLETALGRFYGVPRLTRDLRLPCAARKTGGGELTSAQLAWVTRVRNLSESQSVESFQPKRLVKLALKLASQSATEAGIQQVPALLREVGVRVIFLEALPRTKIDGVALWLAESPVVGLSLRFKRVDSFFFTLLHEVAHVCNEDGKDHPRLDIDLLGGDADEDIDPCERRANQAACDWLIPPDRLKQFIGLHRPRFSRAAVTRFGEELGIHPAIVVGRLHFEGLLPHSHLRPLLGDVRQLLSNEILQ